MVKALSLHIYINIAPCDNEPGSRKHIIYHEICTYFCCAHDDVIKWKHFPRYWPFVWGIHRSPVNSPNKGQ